MRTILTIIYVGISCFISAQTNLWSDSLAENAHQITIFDDTEFIIQNQENSTKKRHYKIAILDKYSNQARSISLAYNEFSTIKYAKVLVTDAFGRKISNYSLKHFEDWGDMSFNLASDMRSKYLEINNNTYPYFIEVSYEYQNKGSLRYPEWRPIQAWNHSIKEASLSVVTNSENDIRYYSQFVDEPTITRADGKIKYSWKVENISVLKDEFFVPLYNLDGMPIVYVAPNAFSVDGYSGNMNTWESLGKWQQLLNQNRNDLPAAEYEMFDDLVKNCSSDEEKIKVVYKYLQDNFRYVSIQLGIGGWQPFKTADVHNKKYGDCKGLTFYTKNVLEYLDIPAYYTLIKAGEFESDIPKDFPIRMFNHAFLTVPLQNDTLFLECTSSSAPFGYLGTFTSDRNALMVTPNGGELIRTKAYSADENLKVTVAHLNILENGDAEAKVNVEMNCLEIEDEYTWVLEDSKEEQKKYLYDNLDWGDFVINDFVTAEITYARLPSTSLNLDLSFTKKAKKTGKRLFYTPFQFNNLKGFQLPKEERVNPIVVKYPFTHIDSVYVVFPKGFEMENQFQKEEVTTEFGTYSKALIIEGDQYLFVRKFIFNKGNYPKSSYQAFRDFINKVQQFDDKRLVLVKKE